MLEKVNLTSVVIVQNKIVPTIIVIKNIKDPTIVNTIIFWVIPTAGKTIPKIEPNNITYNPINLQQQCVLQIKVFELGWKIPLWGNSYKLPDWKSKLLGVAKGAGLLVSFVWGIYPSFVGYKFSILNNLNNYIKI